MATVTTSPSPDQALLMWAVYTSDGKAHNVLKRETDSELYSVDQEAVIAAHVDKFMYEVYGEEKRGHIKILVGDMARCDYTATDWFYYNKVLLGNFGRWLRLHPMPGFSRFEKHNAEKVQKK